MNAAEYLRALAETHGFTYGVETRRTTADNPTIRPARGDGPLVLALFVADVWHGWTKDDPVYYGHVSITHAPTGFRVDRFTHPFTTARAPERPWLIPATPKGIAFAETMRQRYLALPVPWDNFPEDTASRLEIELKVRTVEPSAETTAKVERDACKQFRAELKARTTAGRWGHLSKTQTATLVRELVRSRFFWVADQRKKAA